MTKPNVEKPILWIGSSLEDLKAFPNQVTRDIGYELHAIQNGSEPSDWKPMQNLGHGILEIRKKDLTGAFRVAYVAKFENAVYVLHAFQKKSQRTAPKDVAIIKARYKVLLEAQHE